MRASLVLDVERDGLLVESVPLFQYEDAVHGEGDSDDEREDVVVENEDHGSIGLVRGSLAGQVPEEFHTVEPHERCGHDLQLYTSYIHLFSNVRREIKHNLVPSMRYMYRVLIYFLYCSSLRKDALDRSEIGLVERVDARLVKRLLLHDPLQLNRHSGACAIDVTLPGYPMKRLKDTSHIISILGDWIGCGGKLINS